MLVWLITPLKIKLLNSEEHLKPKLLALMTMIIYMSECWNLPLNIPKVKECILFKMVREKLLLILSQNIDYGYVKFMF